MLHSAILIAPAAAASLADHSSAIRAFSITACVICLLLFATFIAITKLSWKPKEGVPVRSISRERAEKSCDTVLSVCALLIPATLGLITWLNDKIGPGIYILPLGLALVFFFILLGFTIHLRFNFFWRREAEFIVTSDHNARFAYWLTTATTAIVLGIVLLSIPVVELGIGWLRFKAPPDPPPVIVECKCKPPDPPPPPPPPPCKQQKYHRHRRPACACKSN